MRIETAASSVLAVALTLVAAPAGAHEPFDGGLVSITFDDSIASQYELARPALEAHGVRGTYYLITMDLAEPGYITSEMAAALAAAGHEVASHSITHPHLPALSDAALALELTGSRDALLSAAGVAPQSLAMPFGEYDDRVIAAIAQTYGSSRTVDSHLNYRDTSHFHLGAHSCTLELAQLQSLVDAARDQRAWLILYLHDVTRTEAGGSTCTVAKLEAVLDYVQQQGLRVVTVSEGVAQMNAALAPAPTLSSDWHYAWVKPEEVVVHGGRYARRITEVVAGSNAYHTVDNHSEARPYGPWELSAVVSPDTRSGLFLQLNDGTTYASAGFDLASGTVKWLNGANLRAAARIEPLGDGWYRCRFILDAIRPLNAVIALLDPSGRAAYPGDATAGLYVSEAAVTQVPPLPPLPLPPEWQHAAGATLDAPVEAYGRLAQALVEDHSTGYHDIVNHSTARPLGQWELSTVAHADGRTGIFLQTNAGGPNYPNAGFDLTTGTVLWNDGGGWDTVATMDDLGDGWFRCRLTVNTPYQPLEGIVGLLSGTRANYTGDGVSGVLLAEALLAQVGAPVLGAVEPATGPTSGGTSVVLSGSGFDTGAAVFFGDVAATVSEVTATAIVATTPAHASGRVGVTVQNPDGTTAVLSEAFTFVAPAPVITGIAPASGPIAGGTAVTIGGGDFDAGAAVMFGAATASGVTVLSPAEIVAVTPPVAAAQLVDVRVVNPDGQSATWTGFTYLAPVAAPRITSITPAEGPLAGGTAVTISGSGFKKGTVVRFGGIEAPIAGTSAVALRVTTPRGAAAGAVDVVVTNPDGQSGTAPGGFSYLPAPSELPAPTQVSAVAGVRRVTLAWGAVPEATSYLVLRATRSGGPYAQVASVAGTSFTDTKVKAGTTYYYVLQARNAASTSARSTEVSATPR